MFYRYATLTSFKRIWTWHQLESRCFYVSIGLGIFTSQLMSRPNCRHAILTWELYKRKVRGPIFEECTSSYSDILFSSCNALHLHPYFRILLSLYFYHDFLLTFPQARSPNYGEHILEVAKSNKTHLPNIKPFFTRYDRVYS